ncbi:MAG: DUF6036 family nucleotidyltransferase [Carboxydocellales bacterium]
MLEDIKKTTDPQIKLLKFMALLTKLVKKINPNITPVVVGGSAVFVYTFGGHITYDIDIVVENRQVVKDVLVTLGFKQETDIRHWFHEDLDLAIELPDEVLAGDQNKIVTLEIEGKEAYIIGIEDLLIDRLNAAKHWQSKRDEEQALALLELYLDQIDLTYLEKKAQENAVLEKLNELKSKLENE